MTFPIVLMTLGILAILATYTLIDKWLDMKTELMDVEADRKRVETEAAELELEIRRESYYGKNTVTE